MNTPRSPDAAAQRPTPDEFAAVAFARTCRAIEGYTRLADRWDVTPPPVLSVLDVAVDAALAAEAALKAVADRLGLVVKARRVVPLFEAVVARPDATSSLKAAVATYRASLRAVLEARNEYLHAGVPDLDASSLLASVRDVIRLSLLLASAHQDLGIHWRDLPDTLWRFDGQPAHFARQVREAFSQKRFEGLPLRCFVSRFMGGSHFRLDGAFCVHSEIQQPHWECSGDVQDLLTWAPQVKAAVGIVGPPEHGEVRTAEGATTIEGTLRLVAHDLDVTVDGTLFGPNPFAAPIYLLPDDDRGWMIGPGEVRLRTLELKMPYRVRVCWYLTPDGRQEVWSEFLKDCDSMGSVGGQMVFHYPGHGGRPAFRGVAALSGTTGPCRDGYQLTEWTDVRPDPHTGMLKGWVWGGVLKLRFWCHISLSVEFGEVEVFDP